MAVQLVGMLDLVLVLNISLEYHLLLQLLDLGEQVYLRVEQVHQQQQDMY